MKATIARKAHFNAAHRLHNEHWSDEKNKEIFGHCNNHNYHGHNYDLIVRVKGEIDPDTGYVIDTKILKDIIKEEVEDKFDHKNLNLDTEEFAHTNPTAEHIAAVIWNNINQRLDSKFELHVTLYETPRNFVEFDGK